MAQMQRNGGRILVIDDERDITSVLSDVLGSRGYSVDTAPDGQQGFDLYRNGPYDVVVTDLKMPGMGGLELLSAVRDLNPDATVIIMTGYATVETAIEALKNGAYDYILKPFKVGELLQIVDRAFEKIRLAAENLQLREQVALLTLSEAVASSLSLDQILRLVVDAVRKEVQADGVELLFRPPGSRRFTRRVAAGDGESLKGAAVRDLEKLEESLRQSHALQWQGAALKEVLTDEAASKVGSALSVPLRRGEEILGILIAYCRSEQRSFLPREEKALFVLGDRAATSLENALLYADLENTFRQTIQGLALALEAKDAYTHGHSENVTRLCEATAREMGCDEAFCATLRQAGVLHDIGKIGISGAILNKSGKLTEQEYAIIKSHPQVGKRILQDISFLRDVVAIVYHHHERYDGKGYPAGLAGEDIPLGARIMLVADTYDAMTSDRPYRQGTTHQQAAGELRRCAGTQFDRVCVEAFLRMMEKNGVT
jgi:putative nucleotidyltransferase with HDIG domain